MEDSHEPPTVPTLREYPGPFGLKMVDLYDSLVRDVEGVPVLPETVPPASEVFTNMEYGDDVESLWSEGRVAEICRYLRGGKSLAIPDEFRHLLPTKI